MLLPKKCFIWDGHIPICTVNPNIGVLMRQPKSSFQLIDESISFLIKLF